MVGLPHAGSRERCQALGTLSCSQSTRWVRLALLFANLGVRAEAGPQVSHLPVASVSHRPAGQLILARGGGSALPLPSQCESPEGRLPCSAHSSCLPRICLRQLYPDQDQAPPTVPHRRLLSHSPEARRLRSRCEQVGASRGCEGHLPRAFLPSFWSPEACPSNASYSGRENQSVMRTLVPHFNKKIYI